MLLSVDGVLHVVAAYVNTVMIASFLNMGTENTKKYAEHPWIKVLFLYTFAYSVIPHKMACLVAVTLFFVVEVKNFIRDSITKASGLASEVEQRV